MSAQWISNKCSMIVQGMFSEYTINVQSLFNKLLIVCSTDVYLMFHNIHRRFNECLANI